MSLRTRLFLSFAMLTLIAVSTALAGYVEFRKSLDQYQNLTAVLVPTYEAVSNLVDLSRFLSDQPMVYAFAETETDRADELARYRQAADDLTDWANRYSDMDGVLNPEAVRTAAQTLIDHGETFIRLVDQNAPNADLQATKKLATAEEDKIHNLLSDAVISLDRDLSRNVLAQSTGVVTAWTVISIVASILTAIAALYALFRFISEPIEQLKASAGAMASGDYSRRAPVTRTDEIGALSVAFNQMAAAVEERQHALTDLNQSLEARVEERTEQLHQAKEQAEAILNNAGDAIILIGQDRGIDRTNPAFLSLFGYADADLAGLTIDRLVDESQRDRLAEALRQAASGTQRAQVELRCRRRDGSEFVADAAFGAVGAEPYLQHILGGFHDITPQKQAQQELEEALRKERELSAMKSGFVSLVSHEFRTPLAVIQSCAELMKRYWDRLTDDRRREKLTEIQAQIDLMVGYLEDFLSVNGTEMVGAKFAPVELDALQFTRDLIDELQRVMNVHTIILSTRGHAANIFVDPKLLRQILVNLLTNAMKYSETGDPVEVEVIGTAEHITIQVRDRGIGIPEEDQPHIFNPFHRGTNIGNVSGTGLGLAIVKRAVEAHRGTIAFESVVGHGTTFTVSFPVVSVEATA